MINTILNLLTVEEKNNKEVKNSLIKAINDVRKNIENFEIIRSNVRINDILVFCETGMKFDYCNSLKKEDHSSKTYFPILVLEYNSKYFLYMDSMNTRCRFSSNDDLINSIVLRIPNKYKDIELFNSTTNTLLNVLKQQKTIYLITMNVESHRTPEENLGLYCLQNYLRKNGFVVDYIDAWLEDLSDAELVKRININHALFIGISGCVSNVKRVCAFNQLLNNKVPIVVGGYGGTFSYKELLNNGVDIISIGEGEQNIHDIALHYLIGKNIKNISSIAYIYDDKILVNKANEDLTLFDAPCLERKYLNLIMNCKSTIDVYSSKGCSGKCVFCSIRKFYNDKGWKSRDNEFIFEEIRNIYLNGGRVVKFVDDSFIDGNRNNKWIEEFSNRIKGITGNDFRFRISIRTNKINNENICLLKNAGLFAVSCGIENFSISALKRMKKAENIEIIENALSILKTNSIYVQAGFILFDDETTFEEIKTNLEYLKKYDWIIIKGIFSEMYAAPGTEYFDKLITEGLSSFKSGNLFYEIKDPIAKKVYNVLHEWHILHQKLYDKLIDPISAPKALSDYGYSEFYDLYRKLFKIEIDFFDKVCADIDFINDEKKYAKDFYQSHLEIINEIETRCDKLYHVYELTYTGKINVFL